MGIYQTKQMEHRMQKYLLPPQTKSPSELDITISSNDTSYYVNALKRLKHLVPNCANSWERSIAELVSDFLIDFDGEFI